MVVKTEYKRSFKPKFQCYVKVYEGNVDYRLQRRQVEAGHSQDAFIWQDPDWESDSENSCDGQGKESRRTPRPASVPVHLYKHKKFNEAYQRRQESQRSIVIQQTEKPDQNGAEVVYINMAKASPRVSPRVSPKVSPRAAVEPTEPEVEERQTERQVGVQTPDWSRKKRHVRRSRKQTQTSAVIVRDLLEKASQTNGDAQANGQDAEPEAQAVAVDKPTRPKKPGQKVPRARKVVSNPRPMSAPLGRPAKKSTGSPVEDRPPFVPYGFKDHERETGTKKTYNVRASVEVYPSALRALRRKQSDIKLREEAAKSAPYRERRQKAVFNEFDDRMRRETSQWDTEYRSHFVGYEKRQYEQQRCSRTPCGLNPESKHEDLRSSW